MDDQVRMNQSTIDRRADGDVPLVVDLDGTLSRTDTLQEAVVGLLARKPLAIFRLPGWLAKGRAVFKKRVADSFVVPGGGLAINEDVLAQVEQARRSGRWTALVTAADQRQADAVAEELDLFDEVVGSSGGRNLKSDAKAEFLVEKFGLQGFDYIGDSKADIPVWKRARSGFTVAASAGLKDLVSKENPAIEHISPQKSKASSALRAMRPHQWTKNLLLFLPLLAAHDFTAFSEVVVGFAAFCLVASTVYIINDLLDLQADRAHPRKRNRPFASGRLSVADGIVLGAACLLLALSLALSTGHILFIATLAVYFAVTFAYSFWIKRKLILDVIVLAGLYTIRVIAGAVVAATPLSPWMLGFSMFLFLSLAAIKRQAELADQVATGRQSSGRAYQVGDIPILIGMAFSAAHAAVVVLALYIASEDVQLLYARPELLWLLCPAVLYWNTRMIMVAHRNLMSDDPIVFAASDKASVTIIIASVIVAALATI
ncbi:MAG: UbiA family prenyltransferase [Pseudomonadota bacterium]